MIVTERVALGAARRIPVRSFRSSVVSSSPASEAEKGTDIIKNSISEIPNGQVRSSNVAKKEYGFMESAEILLAQREKPRLVGRWDWHAWQLFVSLLPPFAVYCLAMYARREMQQMEEDKRAEKEAVWETELAEEEQKHASTQLEREQMQTRLEALEELVNKLQSQLERSAEGAAEESSASSSSTEPDASSQRSWLSWLGLQHGQQQKLGDSAAISAASDGPEAVSSSDANELPYASRHGRAADKKSHQSSEAASGAETETEATPSREGGSAASMAAAAADASHAADAVPREEARDGKQSAQPQSRAHEAESQGSRGWWLPDLAAWLLPGRAAGSAQPEPADSRVSSSQLPGGPGAAARVGEGAGSAIGQGPDKAGVATEKPREPSQTPTDRRMSGDEARDAEHYKEWRERRNLQTHLAAK